MSGPEVIRRLSPLLLKMRKLNSASSRSIWRKRNKKLCSMWPKNNMSYSGIQTVYPTSSRKTRPYLPNRRAFWCVTRQMTWNGSRTTTKTISRLLSKKAIGLTEIIIIGWSWTSIFRFHSVLWLSWSSRKLRWVTRGKNRTFLIRHPIIIWSTSVGHSLIANLSEMIMKHLYMFSNNYTTWIPTILISWCTPSMKLIIKKTEKRWK